MIDQIEKPKIERVEIGESNRYGKFIVNPLERGFGQTLGKRFAACCSIPCRALP